MIARIGTVIVPVADQDAALAFYRDTLGFEVRLDAPFPGGRWLEGGAARAETTPAPVRGGGAGGAETTLALVAGAAIEVSLATDDAATDHAALLSAGADADPELIEM